MTWCAAIAPAPNNVATTSASFAYTAVDFSSYVIAADGHAGLISRSMPRVADAFQRHRAVTILKSLRHGGADMYEVVCFTRMDLFEKVWTVPLRKAAKEIGISDVALGKACRKSNIPLPGRGYWLRDARLRRRPSLPPGPSGHEDTVEFRVLKSKPPVAALSSRISPGAIAVMPELNNPHPLVARTRRLKRKPISENGWVSLDIKEAINLKVTPNAFDRALRLMDALIKASEKLGFIWHVLDSGKTVVEIDGQTVEIALVEKLTRREVAPPAPSGRASSPTWTYHSRIKYEPTGLLSFRIDQPTYRIAARKTWNDTPRRTLDHHLDQIIAGLPAMPPLSGRAMKNGKRNVKNGRRSENDEHNWPEKRRVGGVYASAWSRTCGHGNARCG